MFILSQQRLSDELNFFASYAKYLEENQNKFPRGALKLATSEWYFNPMTSGCPHDGWLEKLNISEPASGERSEIRKVEIHIELLGAWHNGKIFLDYSNVLTYQFNGPKIGEGHGDWLYDEYRVSDEGDLIHEIEWADGAHWLIVAEDVAYDWLPFVDGHRFDEKAAL